MFSSRNQNTSQRIFGNLISPNTQNPKSTTNRQREDSSEKYNYFKHKYCPDLEIKRENLKFQAKSEVHDKYPDYQKTWRKCDKKEVMPRNDWPHIVDTRRTLVPNLQEKKDFCSHVNTKESHRNYNGKGNLNALIVKGSDDFPGFHNSNHLYRGTSAE